MTTGARPPWFARLFFVPRDPRRLGLVRIGAALSLLTHLVVDNKLIPAPHDLARIPHELVYPVPWSWPLFIGGPPSNTTILAVRISLIVGMTLLLLGYRTRLVTVLTVPVALAYFGLNFSFRSTFSLQSAAFLALLLGLFAPWGDGFSLDALRRGTPPPSPRHGFYVRMFQLVITVLMVSAAVEKIVIGKEAWFGSDILAKQILFANKFLLSPTSSPDVYMPLSAMAKFLLAHPKLPALLTIGTLVFELSFLVAFLFPSWGLLWVVGGLFFHSGIYLTMPGVSALVYLPLYLSFVPLERFVSTPTPTTDRPRRFAAPAIVIGFFLGQALVAGQGGQKPVAALLWPFADMNMFTWRPYMMGSSWAFEGAGQTRVTGPGEVMSLPPPARALFWWGVPDPGPYRDVWLGMVSRSAAETRCRLGLPETELVIRARAWDDDALIAATPERPARPRTDEVSVRIPLGACPRP